jgi:hypothetical protein
LVNQGHAILVDEIVEAGQQVGFLCVHHYLSCLVCKSKGERNESSRS